MALTDFLSLTDEKLATTFERKSFDHQKARDAFVARLDRAAEQFNAGGPQRGRKMFSVNNAVVKLTLPIAIEGRSEFLIPSERFADALRQLRDSASSGDLDKQLEAHPGAIGKRGDMRRTRKPRAPMSEEAKAAMNAKRRATMAARGIKPGRRPTGG